MTRGIVHLACGLGVVLFAASLLSACGGARDQAVVAHVDGHSLTRANLERWTAIEAVLAHEAAPTQAVPRGVVPDPPSYAACVSYLASQRAHAGQEPLPRKQLKDRCEERHTALQRHVLEILLTSYWLHDDAAEKGVNAKAPEVAQVIDRLFPSAAAYDRYLAITGERPSDERLIVEKDLLDTKLLQLAERRMPKGSTTSEREHQHALIQTATAFTNKWKARTTCSAGYVVPECKQYNGPRSLVAP